MRRTPLYAAAAILTLAVGVGANSTVFTFVESFLLRPLPVRDPGRLVFLNWGQATNVSYPNYLDLRHHNRAFANLFAYRCIPVNISFQAPDNDRVRGLRSHRELFRNPQHPSFSRPFFRTCR
jgi:putative ABC transport system permease protein